MKGKTNVGGGSAFAVIDVTYIAGAICTCSNGTRTMKAKDDSGHWLFVIPKAGVWTVTATYNGGSKSETVNVSESKAYMVNISELILYYYGNTYDDVTGGWKSAGGGESSGSFEVEETRLNVAVGYHGDRSAFTDKSIELTAYKTLEVEIAWNNTGTGHYPYMGVCSTKPGATPSYLASKKIDNTTKHIETLDITNITGANYIAFSGSEVMNIYIYSAKLLP